MTLIHKMVDANTGEVIERPYTTDEIKKHDLGVALLQKEQAAAEAKAIARRAILDRLGLTQEEAALLLS